MNRVWSMVLFSVVASDDAELFMTATSSKDGCSMMLDETATAAAAVSGKAS